MHNATNAEQRLTLRWISLTVNALALRIRKTLARCAGDGRKLPSNIGRITSGRGPSTRGVDMQRYFIEATGPFNYNTSGVFYPYLQPTDFSAVLKKHGILKHSWCNNIAGTKVLCFSFEGELKANSFENDLPYGLRISKRNF